MNPISSGSHLEPFQVIYLLGELTIMCLVCDIRYFLKSYSPFSVLQYNSLIAFNSNFTCPQQDFPLKIHFVGHLFLQGSHSQRRPGKVMECHNLIFQA